MTNMAFWENIAWAVGSSIACGCAFIATESFHALWCYLPAMIMCNSVTIKETR